MKRIILIALSILTITCSCSRSAASEVQEPVKADTTKTVVASQSQAQIHGTPVKQDDGVSDAFRYLTLFNLVALICVFALLIVVYRRTASERIGRIIFKSAKYNDDLDKIWFNLPEDLPRKIQKLNNEVRRLQGEVEELNNIVAGFERSGAASRENVVPARTVAASPEVPAPHKVIYAKNFRAGIMTICEEREAQFKLSLANEDSATFEFCGDLESAKLNFDGTFDGVCNTEGSSIDSTKIITVVPGQAARCDEGWKVLTKSTVRFE